MVGASRRLVFLCAALAAGCSLLVGEDPPPPPPAQKQLQCSLGEPIGGPQLFVNEVGIRVNGRTLLGRLAGGTDLYQLDRSAIGDLFPGAWQQLTPPPDLGFASDFSFFEYDGAERVILSVAVDAGTRVLNTCGAELDGCEDVVVNDSFGPIEGDLDGPATGITEDGRLVGLFNRSGTIALAFADDPKIWNDATRLFESTPGDFDDPALARDGSVAVHAVEIPAASDAGPANFDLVASFSDDGVTWSEPSGVEGTNTMRSEASPELFQHDDGTLELFFSRGEELLQSSCSVVEL